MDCNDINIINYVPLYYRKDDFMLQLLNSENEELKRFCKSLDETLNQFFVDTATYSLDTYEKELGLTKDPTMTIEQRRERIKAKFRSVGTTTIEMVKNVCNAFIGGKVDVIENSSNYEFTIKFIDILGIPSKIDDLYKVIEDIKPAHLNVKYEFTYNLVKDLVDKNVKVIDIVNQNVKVSEMLTHQF